jgi:hypothetical protein
MDFFRGIEQFEIDFEGEKGKIPVFYRSTYGVFGFFIAKSSKVKELLPTRIKEKFKVPELIPGVTFCGIAGFMYKDSSLGPYNEVAITFPVQQKPKIKSTAFILNLLDSIVKGEFHVHVKHLPVTTKIAKDAGVIIYNYPKFIADIEFQNGGSFTLAENKKEILSFKIKKDQKLKFKIKRKKFLFTTYQEKDGAIIKAEVLAEGENILMLPGGAEISFSRETQIGKELDEILTSKKAIMSMAIENMKSILHLPVKLC